jgi:endonuclease/exonuclease/phosphatase family metal-dependent hydrolase
MRILRCLTLNLWGAEPPLARRMEIIAQGIAALAPDVVALQEVQDRPDLRNQAVTLAEATGMTPVFAPAVAFRGGHEGLAFLSRWPIVAHEARSLPHATSDEQRIVLSAAIAATAGQPPTWVHVTHLNYRLAHGRQREEQVIAIDEVVAGKSDSVPQILLGDFNARPESDEIRWLCGLTTLAGRRTSFQDAWGRRHPALPGWTWAAANPYTAPLAFLQCDRRLDYIFVTPERRDGRGRILDCRIVFDQPAADGVYASDHYGLIADVQITPDAAGAGVSIEGQSGGPVAASPAVIA